jgi:ActR/RegA family two-component response regulator
MTPEALGPSQPSWGASLSRRRVHVLVVDDDLTTRHFVDRALAGSAEVRACTNVQDALRIIDAGPVDAVVLDLILFGTGSNGLELLRRMPRDRRPRRIVVLTGWHAAASAARELGADAVLAKPSTAPELRHALTTPT